MELSLHSLVKIIIAYIAGIFIPPIPLVSH